MRLSISLLREAALGDRVRVVLADRRPGPRRAPPASSPAASPGMPTLAKFIAMPPPIVPAPMIAADLISRVGVSSGTSGIFAAARSAKNRWRSAFDSVVATSSSKQLRARARCPRRTAASPPPRRSRRSRRRRDSRATPWPSASRAAAKNAAASAARASPSVAQRGAADASRATTRWAKASAPASEVALRRSRRSGRASALLRGDAGRRETIMSSAALHADRRGRRCVPPAPGRSPSFTSGSPSCAPGAATR